MAGGQWEHRVVGSVRVGQKRHRPGAGGVGVRAKGRDHRQENAANGSPEAVLLRGLLGRGVGLVWGLTGVECAVRTHVLGTGMEWGPHWDHGRTAAARKKVRVPSEAPELVVVRQDVPPDADTWRLVCGGGSCTCRDPRSPVWITTTGRGDRGLPPTAPVAKADPRRRDLEA